MRAMMMAAAAVLLAWSAGALAQKKPPYWASIAAGEAMLRTGPGRNYPATWLYKRRGLPVQVVEVYQGWRKVVDPDGETGWMLASLLTEERSVMITGGVRDLRATPDQRARVVWRAEPGVIGMIRACADGWCSIDVGGKRGYVATAHVWGVGPSEEVD